MTDDVHYFVGVAAANHVARGLEAGFMQVNHGKAAPLRRLKPGDGIVYYSPTAEFGEKTPYQHFTAIGYVARGEPYVFDMGNGFVPFRRNVEWRKASPAPIRPLLEILSFTQGKTNWGYAFRFGLIAISAEDFVQIGKAMGLEV